MKKNVQVMVGAREAKTSDARVVVARESLILGGRVAAKKIAGKLLRSWGAHLPEDEITSVCNLALCEAAKGFNPKRGANFVTYLYFYLRGYLIREFNSRANSEWVSSDEQLDIDCEAHREEAFSTYGESNPECEAIERSIQRQLFQAVGDLEGIERRVILAVFYEDMKVARAARKLGYSRGYLSEVKTSALRKLRVSLDCLKEAA